jgi:aspartate kinase
MFQALADKGINIQVISTSEIKISVLIDSLHRTRRARTAHGVRPGFGLSLEGCLRKT